MTHGLFGVLPIVKYDAAILLGPYSDGWSRLDQVHIQAVYVYVHIRVARWCYGIALNYFETAGNYLGAGI